MFKYIIIIITLIFSNSIITVYAPDPAPITLLNSDIATVQHAERVLAKIEPREALPVVLIRKNQGTEEEELYPPDDINKAVLLNGKMISGTEFRLMDLATQIFLCPKQNSEENCLVPKKFENLEQLQCPEQPITDVMPENEEEESNKCGTLNLGTSFIVFYDICPAEGEYQYKNTKLEIYKFCYEEMTEKTLFTTHSISSPKLLNSKLLYREQQLNYNYYENDRFTPKNLDTLMNVTESVIISGIVILRRKYMIQNLVPSEDMPFGISKKAIKQYFNVGWQHSSIFDFWMEINDKVREKAIQSSEFDFIITTGVTDSGVDDIVEDRRQIYTRWVKMVIARTKNREEFAGIAFLMNNFLNFNTSDQRQQLLTMEMELYCPQDFCNIRFKRKVELVGSQVKCCKVTPVFEQLLGFHFRQDALPLLKIGDLTIDDTTETQT